MNKLLLTSVAALLLACAAFAEQPGEKVLVLKDRDGVAIQGYDPVAYFTDQKPAKGSAKFQSEYKGAIYRFTSADHKRAFDSEPEKFAPAFGGYCGYAASIDRLSPISPEWFQIVNGRLILQHNKKSYDLFNKELNANIVKGDKNWPALVVRHGTGSKTLVATDKRGVAIGGYDPVTYFADGGPQKGDAKIQATYNGALYHFISERNRETFEKDPSRYAPAYGGYCGYAASIGKVRPADPLLWSIVDGQLIVQHTKGAVELWEKDVKGNKARADQLWPKLVQAKAGRKDPVDSLWSKSILAEVR